MIARSRQRATLTTILAIAIVANAIVLALSFLGIDRLRENALREAEVRSQNLALAVDLALTNEISKIDLSLKTVGAALRSVGVQENRARDDEVAALVVQQKSLLPETEGWSITNAEGTIVFHQSDLGPAQFSVADRDYFKALKEAQEDRLQVSKPLVSRLSGAPIIIFARAIHRPDGTFDGAILVPLPVSYFNRLLAGFDVGNKGLLTLRDAEHQIIKKISLDESETLSPQAKKDVSREFSRAAASARSAVTYTAITPFDREERIFTYRAISNAPLYAHVGISTEQSLTEWRAFALRLTVYVGLTLLLANTLAWLIYRQWRIQQENASMLKSANENLQSSLRQLRDTDAALLAAQEAGNLGTYTLNLATGFWHSSAVLDDIFGIDAAFERTIEGWLALIHPEDRESLSCFFFDEVLGKGQLFDREYRLIRPNDGQMRWVHGLGRLDFDDQGKPVRLVGIIRDISTRRFAEDRLRLTSEVFEHASEGILITDREGVIIETNPAFSLITGYSSEEVKGQTPRLLKSGLHDAAFYQKLWKALLETGHWDGLIYNRRKDGQCYAQQSRLSAIRDGTGSIARFAAVISDVTELKESQKRLERMAYHDALTDLPNRARLAERIQHAMLQCQRGSGTSLGVCCLDLDGFKAANDRWGHAVGDQLLCQVAQRLNASTRGEDTVARFGGDEFVILLSDLKDEDDGIETMTRLMKRIAIPFEIGNIRESLTVSVGMTIYPGDAADDPDTLLRHADHAMYEAKRNGKNRLFLFDRDSEQRQRACEERFFQVSQAFVQDELRLHYQPKVAFRSGQVVGVEALIRWQHPERGLLPPSEFLPAVEGTELTFPLGEWILREALRQKQAWQRDGIQLQVSINVFAAHLQRADFVDRLRVILSEFPDLEPGEIELEILETTSLENLQEVTTKILECRKLGVQFSLDDFGTGYSSLTYLRQLPVTRVKIDRSFVRDILSNPEDQVLVQGIVGMSRTLGRQVVAEGLETIEHGIELIRQGCDWGQGYGIARPMAPDALSKWLHEWSFPDTWRNAAVGDNPQR